MVRLPRLPSSLVVVFHQRPHPATVEVLSCCLDRQPVTRARLETKLSALTAATAATATSARGAVQETAAVALVEVLPVSSVEL